MALAHLFDNTWEVSMGPDMLIVEQIMARATAGAVYQTYQVSADNSNPWKVRYRKIQDYLDDYFGKVLADVGSAPPSTLWRDMIAYLKSTPPFDRQLWPYHEFGASRRMKRPASPIDASVER